MERRVVLLSRDPGLASVTGRLLSNGDRIAHFRSAAELSNWSTPAVAAVVLDSQPQARRLSYKQVRDRYDGPLVMLLDKDERRPDLPPDGARQFLHRPFKAAELSNLLGNPTAELGPFEAAIIAAWSRHATAEQAVRARRGPSYRINWRPSLRRRARAWAATVVAAVGLLVVLGVSDQGPCTSACTGFGGAVAGAAESATPQVSGLAGGSGGGRGAPPDRVVGRLLPAPDPNRRPARGDRGRWPDPVHQPHQHRRHPPTDRPQGRRRGPRTPRRHPAPDHQPPAGDQPAPDNGPANHDPTHHHAATDNGASNHRAADHGPTDDGASDHGPANHRAADHGPTDDGASDHGPANHGTADDGSSHHRRPHHRRPLTRLAPGPAGPGRARPGSASARHSRAACSPWLRTRPPGGGA